MDDVLDFINDFYDREGHNDSDDAEVLRNQFMRGYCYYFAHILKTAFNRGTVCLAYPLGHIVWVDDDGTPYDADGINHSECSSYIPESFVGDMIDDFKRVRGKSYCATETQIVDLGRRWEEYQSKEVKNEISTC